MKLSTTQKTLSAHYGITESGDKGWKVKGKVFNKYTTAFENWQDALNWARGNVKEYKYLRSNSLTE